MKYKAVIFIILLSYLLPLFSQETKSSIEDLVFYGLNIETSDYKGNKEELEKHFSIAYSPFLPAGAIYEIKNIKTGKTAIVQIGIAEVNKSPFVLYLPNNLFSFFSSPGEKEIELKLKFIGWNKDSEKAVYLDILNYIVVPENAISEIKENGKECYYLQLGAFTYYQNAYPQILKMIPFIKVVPKFYLVKLKHQETKDLYRIIAGPFYSLKEIRQIGEEINNKIKDAKIYIKTGENILKELNETP